MTKNNLIKEKTVEFLNKQFGNKLDRDKEDWDVVIHKKAWSDAMAYVGQHVWTGETGIRKKSEAEIAFKESFGGLKCIDGYLNTNNQPSIPIESNKFTIFGLWQKYASMRFKYMYCVQIYTENKVKWFDINEYDNCWCPVDRYISRSIFRISPIGDSQDAKEAQAISWNYATNSGKKAWSKMNSIDHEELMNIIEDSGYLDGNNSYKLNGLNYLDFDILEWRKL